MGGAIGVAFLFGPAKSWAQLDDFNDGDDTDWTRYDTIGTALGSPQGMFSFPNGGYRLKTPPSPAPAQVGPARIGSLRNAPVYADFYISVDLVNWDDSQDQAMGILARITNIGLGTTDGYAFTYQNDDTDISISRIADEDADDVSGTAQNLQLDPTKDYRLVFIGRGEQLEGRVYELPDVVTPIAVVSGTDASYGSGICGLIIYDNGNATGMRGADATFDNYFATIEEQPRLSLGDDFGTLLVKWSRRHQGFILQTSPTLGPTAIWTDIDSFFIQETETEFLYGVDARAEPLKNQFFRLNKPAPALR